MYWYIWISTHPSQKERTIFKIEIHIVPYGPTQDLLTTQGETSPTSLIFMNSFLPAKENLQL